jgi:hypothetical protein
MKKFIVLLFISTFIFSACKKEDKEVTLEEFIVAKWKFQETNTSNSQELGFHFLENKTLYVYSDLDFNNSNRMVFEWYLIDEDRLLLTLKENNPQGNPDIFDNVQINTPTTFLITGWDKNNEIIHLGKNGVNYDLNKL